jgi:predicted heme/steroid binding protein/uncharacterized membrane protein
MVKKFSKDELKKFDGKSGVPIYIAYKNRIYDVTQSLLWKYGIHANTHKAGIDLTESLVNAPHREEVFERYPLVGELSEEPKFEPIRKKFLGIIRAKGIDRRFHRMVSHFPISLLMTASFLLLLYEYFDDNTFEIAAYYTLSLGVVASPVSVLSGLWSWKTSYLGTMTKIFKRKIIFSIPLLVIGFTSVVLRILYPGILTEKSLFSWVYFIMVLSLTPIVITLGYYGGKITFLRAF